MAGRKPRFFYAFPWTENPRVGGSILPLGTSPYHPHNRVKPSVTQGLAAASAKYERIDGLRPTALAWGTSCYHSERFGAPAYQNRTRYLGNPAREDTGVPESNQINGTGKVDDGGT